MSLPQALLDLADALEASPAGAAMRGTPGLYPAVNLAHLLGVVLLVGGIGAVDLRILGLGRAVPIAALSRFLTPLAVGGLLLTAASGVLLFCADAGPFTRAPLFQAKMAMVVLALANAAVYRRTFGDLAEGCEAPPWARTMAGVSLGLWLGATAAGRWLAYA